MIRKETKTTKGSTSYYALTPIPQCDTSYIEALEYALEHKDIKNIAIAGPYGSGKSSIIQGFFDKHPFYKKNALFISLASFHNNEVNKELLEYSILQQMFYHAKLKQLPDSRFKRIRNLGKKELYVKSFLTVVWLLSAAYLSISKWADLLSVFNETTYFLLKWNYIVAWAVFLFGLIFFVSKSVRFASNSKISRLNIRNAEVELSSPQEHSILNKHLDEILYFFEATKINVLILEDLDRFNNLEMFVKLRELNTLINNSKQINRQVVFIYALRDDLFLEHDDRTKFFDFIVPVIPFIDSSNLENKFLELLDENNDIFRQFVRGIVTWSMDMRILKNICNEYTLYKKVTKQSTDIDSLKLLALIVYKNLYLSDFIELHKNSGRIHSKLVSSADTLWEKEEKNKKQAEIINYMIDNEYVDKDSYPKYISYSYDIYLNKNDNDFLNSVKRNNPLAYDYKLSKPNDIFKRMLPDDFKKRSVLNFDMLDYLLQCKSENEKNEISFKNIIEKVCDKSDESNNFVNEFLSDTRKDKINENIAQFNHYRFRYYCSKGDDGYNDAMAVRKKDYELAGLNEETNRHIDGTGASYTSLILDYFDCTIEVKLGTFIMGSPENENGRHPNDEQQKKVEINQSFNIGKYPVTQILWLWVMNENPAHFKGNLLRPVEDVNWCKSVEFCNALSEKTNYDKAYDKETLLNNKEGYRLLYEKEWEYAACGGHKNIDEESITNHTLYCGVGDDLNKIGWYSGNAQETTHSVGEKEPNNLGIYDMSGNVWEWCEDCYEEDPSDRAIRGGSWGSSAGRCRSAFRYHYGPGSNYKGGIGFRIKLQRNNADT